MTWFMHTNTDSCENWGNTSQIPHAAELDYDYIIFMFSLIIQEAIMEICLRDTQNNWCMIAMGIVVGLTTGLL